MFHRIFHAGAALALAAGFASPALADQAFPATLAGHAMIPAATYIPTPADAPADLKTPGKFTSGRRAEVLGSVMGMSFERPTGIGLPMPGQPIQGHSGIKTMPDGSFWVLTDNGFGSRANSPDVMLYLNHYRIDWTAGTLARLATIFLHDPDKKVPFRITHEGTEKRYLTGSDFDAEGFQIIGTTLWIGDEFGPYVIKADMTGRILGVFETMTDGKPVRSPEHFSVATSNSRMRRNSRPSSFSQSFFSASQSGPSSMP